MGSVDGEAVRGETFGWGFLRDLLGNMVSFF